MKRLKIKDYLITYYKEGYKVQEICNNVTIAKRKCEKYSKIYSKTYLERFVYDESETIVIDNYLMTFINGVGTKIIY